MMTVLISVRPKWCKLIIEGKKTVEVRKTRPKLAPPFRCLIYCTAGTGRNTLNIPIDDRRVLEDWLDTGSMVCMNCPIGNQKIIGEFVCNSIVTMKGSATANVLYNATERTCLTADEIARYAGSGKTYYWHMSELKIYENPITLDEVGLERPPQSWRYLEVREND